MHHKSVDDARDRPRDHRTGIVHAIPHRIAHPDLDRDPVFIHQLHQFQAERDHEAVNVRPGDVLQVASRAHARLHAFPYNGQIVLHGLPAGHFQFIEYMVIRTAHQNAGLFEADLPDQFEVLLAGADPARHLREFIAFFQTAVHRIPVLLTVQEELALADLALRAAQPVQIVIDRHDLFRGVRCSGLLPVPECGVRDPDLIRHVMGHDPVVKCDLRHLFIPEQIPEDIRRLHIDERIHVLLQLQQIRMII